MRIRTPDGGQIPVRDRGQCHTRTGYASIRRIDRERTVNVTAGVDDEVTNENDVLSDFEVRHLPALLAGYPDVKYSFEGIQQLQEEFRVASSVPF